MPPGTTSSVTKTSSVQAPTNLSIVRTTVSTLANQTSSSRASFGSLHHRFPPDGSAMGMLGVGDVRTLEETTIFQGTARPDQAEHPLLSRGSSPHHPTLNEFFEQLRRVTSTVEPLVDMSFLFSTQEAEDDPLVSAQSTSHNSSVQYFNESWSSGRVRRRNRLCGWEDRSWRKRHSAQVVSGAWR